MSICFAKPEETVIIVIDVQEKLCGAIGNYDVASTSMIKLLQAARSIGVQTIVTEQYPKGLGGTVEELKTCLSENTTVLEKTSFSCWGAEGFNKLLEPKKQLIIIGMETHVCVQQTVIEALNKGYRVVIPADAVCSRKSMDMETSLKHMQAKGAEITTVESIAFDWLGDAKSPYFRDIAGFLR